MIKSRQSVPPSLTQNVDNKKSVSAKYIPNNTELYNNCPGLLECVAPAYKTWNYKSAITGETSQFPVLVRLVVIKTEQEL